MHLNLPFLKKKPKVQTLGTKGECIAERYLRRKGFRVLEKNYQNRVGRRLGEIDIVAERDGAIVFVEVKTREGIAGAVFPEDNLTPHKFRKLERIARFYLQEHEQFDVPYHFDALAITLDSAKNTAHVRHFEYIF